LEIAPNAIGTVIVGWIMPKQLRALNWFAIATLIGVLVADAWPVSAAVPDVAPPAGMAVPADLSNCYEFPGDYFTSPWTGLSYLSGFPTIQIDNNADTWDETYIQGYVVAPEDLTITSFEVHWTASSGGADVYTEVHLYGFTGSGWFAGSLAINDASGITHHSNGSYIYTNPSPAGATVRTIGIDLVIAPENDGYNAPTSLTLDYLQICTTSTVFATQTPVPPTATSGGPTFTPSATATATNTPGPSPTPGPPSPGGCNDSNSPPNLVCNGNFELPHSTLHDWVLAGQSSIRANNDSPTNGGLAYCGRQFANVNGAGISQRVYLPAGTLYLTARLRKKQNDGDFIHPQVEIVGADTTDLGRQWVVIDGKHGESAFRSSDDFGWIHYQASHAFLVSDPGYYDVKIYNVIPAHQEGGSFLGTPVVTTVDWAIDTNPANDFQVDDIFLSTGGYKDYCPNGAGSATATPVVGLSTRTPTPTKTRTPTPGGPTATPRPVSGWSNCDFEQGLAGWRTVNNVVNRLAGGPVGAQFARLLGNDATLSQSFTWPGGFYFFTGWIGPGSAGSIKIISSNGVVWNLWSQTESTPAWKLVRIAAVNLPAGDYQLVVRGNQFQAMEVDGLMPGANDYRYCGSGAGATPTSGPTSFVTPTGTPTQLPGPTQPPLTRTPTATRPTSTPNATWTPSATYSPVPSATPGNDATATAQAGTATGQAATATALSNYATQLSNTATAQASNTPASATPSPTAANNATATAYASITPATGTPTGTPFATLTPLPPPSATTMSNPPPQPEPAPQADCQRPDNPFNLPGWMEYEVCTVLTWTLWNDENSNQMLNIQATLQVYEPLGTLNELSAARDTLQGEINQYDWANTGLQSGELPDLSILVPDTTPDGLLTGNFDLTPDPSSDFAFQRTCGLQIANVFGDAMSQGMCAAINWMMVTGILNWVQYFFDLAIWIAFIRYGWYVVTTVIPTIL
jgi:hypothetical protein